MNHDKKTGFTLIELMLSMSFIAVLMIAVALTTIHISNTYTKGITLREVNQVGRSVSEELQRSIAASSPFDVTPKVNASPATAASKYVKLDGGGRLCLGQYSYAWNYGRALAGGNGAPTIVNKYGDVTNTPVRFAKVDDPSAALCATPGSIIDRAKATEMLTSGDRDLAVHDFIISTSTPSAVSGQALYAITFVLGTNDKAQLTTNNTSCRPPGDGVGNESYCSVNQFDIIARAGNEAKGSE